MAAINVKQTKVYQKAFEQAMNIFELSKSFPKEEKYSINDQVRRLLRNVCGNFAEAYHKKIFPAHFFLNSPIVMQRITKQMSGLILPSSVNMLKKTINKD